MSTEQKNPVFQFNNDEPEMQEAYQRARTTFRLFWRELSWEYRRIIPALHLACVKTAFADRPLEECKSSDRIEQMWVGDVRFDGRIISGKLLNQPNYVKSVKEGDTCAFPFELLTDWMYAISSRVYGAYTVNLMRSRMTPAERQVHDNAWGLDFGDTGKILLTPDGQADLSVAESEHPMSVNMKPSFADHLQKNPEIINQPDERGWTLLHHQSLAGNALVVEVLLEYGADRSLQTNDGVLAIDLARLMGWDRIVSLLAG